MTEARRLVHFFGFPVYESELVETRLAERRQKDPGEPLSHLTNGYLPCPRYVGRADCDILDAPQTNECGGVSLVRGGLIYGLQKRLGPKRRKGLPSSCLGHNSSHMGSFGFACFCGGRPCWPSTEDRFPVRLLDKHPLSGYTTATSCCRGAD